MPGKHLEIKKHVEVAKRLYDRCNGVGEIEEGETGRKVNVVNFRTNGNVAVKVENILDKPGFFSTITLRSEAEKPHLTITLIKGKYNTFKSSEGHADNLHPHMFELISAATEELANLD